MQAEGGSHLLKLQLGRQAPPVQGQLGVVAAVAKLHQLIQGQLLPLVMTLPPLCIHE